MILELERPDGSPVSVDTDTYSWRWIDYDGKIIRSHERGVEAIAWGLSEGAPLDPLYVRLCALDSALLVRQAELVLPDQVGEAAARLCDELRAVA